MLRAAVAASALATCALASLRGPAEGRAPPPAASGAGDVEGAREGRYVTSVKGTKILPWTPELRTVREALEITFPKEAGWPNACFLEGRHGCSGEEGVMTRERVADWVQNDLLGGKDPFEEHGAPAGGVPVPWPEEEGVDQLGLGQYVGYSRRQVCFIVAKSLLGAGTEGYDNGLARLLKTTVSWCGDRVPGVQRDFGPLKSPEPTGLTGDFGMGMWHLLAACAADPTLRDGRQGPLLLVGKGSAPAEVPAVKAMAEKAALKDADLGVCRYNDGDAGPVEHPALRSLGPQVCTPPTFSGPGMDFMAGGRKRVRGQAIQDITAKFLGGYVFGTSCGLGGGQDERLMTYLPEVFVLTFFLSQEKERPQLREPAWVLGARMLFIGLDGSARYNTRLELDPFLPMTSDLVEVKLGEHHFSVGNSAPFLGFMTETQDFLAESAYFQGSKTFKQVQADLFAARRNAHPLQRAVDEKTWFSFMYQVRAWYSAVALTSYHPDLRAPLRKLVLSLGTGPWLAGLWWGDSQLGLLAVWIAQAIAASTWEGGLPLEYYVYADFTENPGNQCFVHPVDDCKRCLARCAADPLPWSSYWLPDYAYMNGKADNLQSCVVHSDEYCGKKGYLDVLAQYSGKTAGELWTDVEATLSKETTTNLTVFDLLLK